MLWRENSKALIYKAIRDNEGKKRRILTTHVITDCCLELLTKMVAISRGKNWLWFWTNNPAKIILCVLTVWYFIQKFQLCNCMKHIIPYIISRLILRFPYHFLINLQFGFSLLTPIIWEHLASSIFITERKFFAL